MNKNNVILRDYQQEILSRIREAWKSYQGVMVQMPTGTGKTYVLVAVIRDFLLGHKQTSQAEVWIVAHRRELVVQIEETVEKYGMSKEGRYIRAMSIQWLSRHWDDAEGEPVLIVIDEAHHALADTYKELWTRYPDAKKLGMTATPCRMSHSGFTDLFDVLLTSWNIAEFIRKGQLSLFDYVSIRPDSEEQRLIDSLEKRGADGDYQVKEMANVLNCRPSIKRLYRSVEQFAHNKKGIVYAISIDHARSIAAYYNNKGIGAVPIDSRTPATERKCLVEDFKAGKVRVLVNVDVFSEGFDCPDVEFVQMARPTLSLAKYLQQVGRGLRKSEGKEACMLIDNVGLYHIFGLPTVAWDWEAMFRGEMAGKGTRRSGQQGKLCMSTIQAETAAQYEGMELIVAHDRLLSTIEEQRTVIQQKKSPELRAWQDERSGFWGLRCGQRKTTEAVYAKVFDIQQDLAAVRFSGKTCGLVDADGRTVWESGQYQSMRFTRNKFLIVQTSDGKFHFFDLYAQRMYNERPEVKRFGKVEMLKVGRTYYSRTGKRYVNNQNLNSDGIIDRRFYVAIFDYKTPPFCCIQNSHIDGYQWGYACLLYGDHESFYYIYRWLADGSIIVVDEAGNYYHAADGKRKEYMGCRDSEAEEAGCKAEIERVARQAQKAHRIQETEKEEKRRRLFDRSVDAIPFRSGMKWGLKVGERITVPPVYRNVKPPVGRYCAVEKNYCQWGIISVDGTVLVEPKYQEIDIEHNGMAVLTNVTGKKVSVKLQ